MLSKTNLEAKKILVLGSSSFAGGWFTKIALDAGYSVFAVSRSENYGTIFCPFDPSSYGNSFNRLALDINRDRSKVIEIAQTWSPEIVVDFAGQGMVAPSWDSPQDWYETNVVAKAEIYNALFEVNSFKKLIKISTPEVYGSNDELITEHHPFSPSTPYSVSHAAIDWHLLALWQQARFPVVFGRFANFYGAHQQLYRIIPLTIVNAFLGRNLYLHGGGTSVRSFIHAIDVGKAILKMIQHGRFGQAYNFGTDEFVSIADLVNKICNLTGVCFSDFVITAEDRRGKDAAYLMDCTKAFNELGWRPEIMLDDGLTSCYQWVESNLNNIRDMKTVYVHKQ